MFRITYHQLAVFICLCNLCHVRNQGVNGSNDGEFQTTTTDPKLLEQYARNTALSFGIFGAIFGVLNIICYIASIYKALKDRKAIQLRNNLKRKMRENQLAEQKEKLLSKVTQADAMEPHQPFVSTVIKKSTYTSIHNPDETNPHYFSKSPTLKRASKMSKKSGPENNPDAAENHQHVTDSN